jgi:uncharacterized protein (TIGR02453 family)
MNKLYIRHMALGLTIFFRGKESMADTTTFNGFPPATLQFLQELAANNNREWFAANRERYEKDLLEPAVAFVLALGARLQRVSPGLQADPATNGSGTLMRIYRDTRFSADKSPYKTRLAGMFWQGPGKKTESPAFGFQFNWQGMDLMAGMFAFPKPMLNAYRDAVDDPALGSELEAAIKQIESLGDYALQGDQYQRVPRGFAEDHARAGLLRYKGLYFRSPAISPTQIQSNEILPLVFQHFQDMAPLQQWLVKVAQEISN